MSIEFVECIVCYEPFPYAPGKTGQTARRAGWSKSKLGWLCPRHRKKSKYNNRKTEVDGIPFDSAKEAARYQELKLLERIEMISDLVLQPRFELQPSFKRDGKTERAIWYVADFKYEADGRTIVEDAKGFRNEIFKLKRKLLLFKYPDIVFLET
jgi:hypothetical protein